MRAAARAGIRLENVSKSYARGPVAVERLNFEVPYGECLVLVGPSGCGKTTTLRLIAGLEDVSAGTIWLGNRPANRLPPRHRDVAMVFQQSALFPHRSVAGNLAGGALPAEKNRAEKYIVSRWFSRLGRFATSRPPRTEVAEIARLVEIEHLLDRRPGQLSGGERQRVAIGRALVRQTGVLLLDEPWSSLDPSLRLEMRRQLRECRRRQPTTTILVTHDPSEASALGERLAVMNRGLIEQVGMPDDVYRRPANRFVAGFIGSPAMNQIVGQCSDDHGKLTFVRDGWSLPVDPEHADRLRRQLGREVVLGIRPADIALTPAGIGGLPAGTGEMRAGECRGIVGEREGWGETAVIDVSILAAHTHPANNLGVAKAPCVQSIVSAECRVERGDLVKLVCDMRRAHWFDPATGRNLLC